MLRKQILREMYPCVSPGVISIPDAATVLVSSEMPGHPVDCICDDQRGPGSTRWIADGPGDQSLVLAFDTARTLHKVSLEVEEPDVSRTQELALSISHDGGQTYREVLRQEYNFSPPGTSFEHEEWHIPAEGVTNLWVWIRPDKGGKPCRASITSLVLE
ncbi:MAG: carbohydrate-binding protein [Nitrospiraceae bacterium]